ncbi:MAG: DNA N-6-adenine-methyltransferase [Mesorhizobium sp.]
MPIGSHQSARPGTDVWLTPPHVLDALGGAESFDLDPCAAIDQPWPTARQHFTIEDNGLLRPWHGRVWMNPPYRTGVVGQFMRRMVDHGQGIALIFARTETAAFHETVWRAADALLFLEGRLHFHVNEDTTLARKKGPSVFVRRGERSPANAGAPSVFCAYGPADSDVLASCGLPGAFVPLRLRSLIFGFASVGSWVDEVTKVIERAGEAVHLDTLYRALADSPKAQRNRHWREKIRQTLQRGPFEPLGDGVWKVAEGRLL